MRNVAIISYAQSPAVRDAGAANEVELILPVITEAKEKAGVSKDEIDFTCSGSCDYLTGAAFSFVMGVDPLGAVPPIHESHVEMDAAWALYEAWVKIQCGSAETALVYGFGKSSMAPLLEVMSLQLDPYYLTPLWPDPVSLAALQARMMLDSGCCTEKDMAEVVSRSRANAKNNPRAQLKGDADVDSLLAEPYHVSPLRRHDCPPISDGASAVVIASAEVAREKCKRPAFIRGFDHRIETNLLGTRDLTRSPSTTLAAERAGVNEGPVDVAELYAPFSHQEIILKEALGFDKGVSINPSGGALAGNIFMASGLSRIGEVAERIIEGKANRGVAHATSGPCLQQNLVIVLEGE
jgi:acetyl-CoA acetyltransferase